MSRSVVRFSEGLNSLYSAEDLYTSLSTTQRLSVKLFADSWNASLPLLCLWTLFYVVLTARALKQAVATDWFEKRCKQVLLIHTVYEADLVVIGYICCT